MLGPAIDKHQKLIHRFTFYVSVVNESEAWPTVVQLRRRTYVLTVIGIITKHAGYRIKPMRYPIILK